MERITMSPEIFSGYTNPYQKNMVTVQNLMSFS